MNVNSSITMNYEQRTMNCLTKTKPIQSQTNPTCGEQRRTTCRVVAPGEDGLNPNRRGEAGSEPVSPPKSARILRSTHFSCKRSFCFANCLNSPFAVLFFRQQFLRFFPVRAENTVRLRPPGLRCKKARPSVSRVEFYDYIKKTLLRR